MIPLIRLPFFRPHNIVVRLQSTSTNNRNPYRKPGAYYEARRNPGWWRRQDFDDKMTWVATVLAIISLACCYSYAEVYRGPEWDPYQDELNRQEAARQEWIKQDIEAEKEMIRRRTEQQQQKH